MENSVNINKPEGETLRLAIKNLGITIENAAIALGISRSSLHSHLNRAHLDEAFKKKVKDGLDIDLNTNPGIEFSKYDVLVELKRKNLSVDQAADLIKVSRTTFYNYLDKIEAYQVSIEDFYQFVHELQLNEDLINKYSHGVRNAGKPNGADIKYNHRSVKQRNIPVYFPFFSSSSQDLLLDLGKGRSGILELSETYGYVLMALPSFGIGIPDFAIDAIGFNYNNDFEATDILVCRFEEVNDDWNFVIVNKIYIVFCKRQAFIGRISIDDKDRVNFKDSNGNTMYWTKKDEVLSVCIVQASVRRYAM